MEVVFQESPEVLVASNTFINVPIILQWEETPLLEVGKFVDAGYTIRFPVFMPDGTEVAKVVGPRIILTEAGKLAKIAQRHEDRLIVCELEGKPILELRKRGPAALKGEAELWAPEGVLITAKDAGVSGLLGSHSGSLQIGGMEMIGAKFENFKVGIQITKTGIALGHGGGGTMHSGFIRSGPAPTRSYLVTGVHMTNSFPAVLQVSATNEATAREIAEAQGVSVQSITLT